MKYFAILLMTLTSACAQTLPHVRTQVGQFDLAFTAWPQHQVKRVEWIVTEQVDQVCQGLAPLRDKTYMACTRFNNTTCTVYTRPNLTLAQLGHEMRHCFEGHWHD